MKKLIPAFAMAMTLLTTSCHKDEAKANDEFDYTVDSFADIEVLRYKVPGFEDLSLNQKKLIYYLTEAALWGRD
ncbi:MAG: dihydrofolate reductase, partial [Muribaculaceae bacterium]|nr:dihydrofolate reductase [Muribaculaceae bacterium]